MNEQLQGKLVEILSGIQTAAKAGGDFALAQMPDIAQSYVAYGRAVALVKLIIFAAIFVESVWVAFRYGYLSTATDRWGDWTDSRISAAAFGTFAAFFSFVVTLLCANTAALVWFAPKVWLLRELADMLK